MYFIAIKNQLTRVIFDPELLEKENVLVNVKLIPRTSFHTESYVKLHSQLVDYIESWVNHPHVVNLEILTLSLLDFCFQHESVFEVACEIIKEKTHLSAGAEITREAYLLQKQSNKIN